MAANFAELWAAGSDADGSDIDLPPLEAESDVLDANHADIDEPPADIEEHAAAAADIEVDLAVVSACAAAWADEAGEHVETPGHRDRRVRRAFRRGLRGALAATLEQYPLEKLAKPIVEILPPPLENDGLGPLDGDVHMHGAIEDAEREVDNIADAGGLPNAVDEVLLAPPTPPDPGPLGPADEKPLVSTLVHDRLLRTTKLFEELALLIRNTGEGATVDPDAAKVCESLTSRDGVMLSFATLSTESRRLGVTRYMLGTRAELLAATRWVCYLYQMRAAIRRSY